jgi:hypothetical protein
MDDCSERYPAVVARPFFCGSWPGLSRPLTPSLLRRCKKGVDARDKRRLGGGKVMRSPRDAR